MYKMSDISKQYKEKLLTADQAAAQIENNSRLHFGTGLGSVVDIDEALSRRADELKGISILTTVAIRKEAFKTYQATESNDNVRFASAHFTGSDRAMSKAGRQWYVPMLFRELPSYWGQNNNEFDVACFQVTPMDEYGNFNVGPQAAEVWGVIRASKKIIVEVNKNMPYAHGRESLINIADVDFVVEGSNTPLAEIPAKDPTDIDKQIASHVVNLMNDNCTLQLGIGALPCCIGTMLAESDFKSIACHTEMLVDSYVDLFNAGKLGTDKPVGRGKAMYAFAGGTKKLYDFIDNNPLCCVAPVDFVNDIHVIRSIDNFYSVNSCIQLDLYGQVCSESAGYQHVSGTGGQLDFVMGAYLSKNGKSFICTPSTRRTKTGELETLIKPGLTPGSIVTTPRMATHYIVTEYGAANLKGKSTWERAESLINISHPDFRDELIKDAEKMGIWTKTSKVTL
ncbi:MAG: acetyl-CoA hydrolase/transferase C-terminal domain-containing protein [Eubacterium sp.]|nr:acetyl-CoA hydrolase/transferase C-terminal domain-containing protein [Eubacterium sp.]